MAYALNIRSDDKTSVIIEQLWEEFSALEENPSMINLDYRPHITFAIYDDCDLMNLRDVFKSVFKTVRKTKITFDGIRFFESADSLVMWANPVLSEEILTIHQRIHDLVDVNSCREHYQPNHWVPHCTVAMSVPLDQKNEALRLADRKLFSFEVVFDIADLVSFLPVQIESEIALV